MKKLVHDAQLSERIIVESAGTGSYHVGEPADRRSAAEARRRGIELDSIARQFTLEDFERYDYIVAMDRRNHGFLKRLSRDSAVLERLSLLRQHDAESVQAQQEDVPDPYYEDNFDEVFDICQAGCSGLLTAIVKKHGL